MSARLLIVDPSPVAQAIVQKIARMMGLAPEDVVVAATSVAAWQQLQSGAFSAIITELIVPDSDGLAWLDRLHNDARLCKIPVVVHTAHHQLGLVAATHGATHVLCKPVRPEALRTVLLQHLPAPTSEPSPGVAHES